MTSNSTSKTVTTLGVKGSSLSAAAVFEVANSLSLIRIDSSSKFSTSSSSDKAPTTSNSVPNSKFSLPNYLTPVESRASLLLLLNKLLLSSSSPAISLPNATAAASRLLGILNSPDFSYPTDEDCQILNPILDYCSVKASAVHGICALLDNCSTDLSVIADAVSALSCEALRADVSSFNSLIDSGDGTSDKDEVGVSTDLKVYLNGSKLIGKAQQNIQSASNVDVIPEIHGAFRLISRTLHAKTRVFLNSSRGGSGTGAVVFLLPLAKALLDLGLSSWSRANIIVGSLGNNDDHLFITRFMEMFNTECPGIDRLKELYKSCQAADYGNDYVKSVHDIYVLANIIRTIISWEAISAFISLSILVEGQGGTDLFIQKSNVVEVQATNSGGDDKSNDKKHQKEKKKNKVVMGKGTAALVQFLKDRLQATAAAEIETRVQKFLLIFDPKDSGFECLVHKVKDIVDSNESRRLPKLPKGTRDFAKEQMAVREKAFSIIGEVFKRHGAMALDTPVFEMRETLMGKYGEDSKLIYDLADQGGELCSLRYDLTVPFARYVAMNGLTSCRRYQIAKVYRRDNPSKGRYREFYQCDFDIAGQFETMGPDFEVIKILTELLDELNIGDYEIKLNHRKLLDGMLDICGVPPEKFRTICSSIDKLDKQSFEQIKKEMVEEKGLTVETADKIGTFVKQRGYPLELLFDLKQSGSKFLENSESLQALNELEILFKALEKSKCINKVVLDLSLARGLDYYTGVIYEAVFKGTTQVGSIAAGGRYDKLIGMFGTKQVPSVGVSLGIERVFTIMEQLQRDQNLTVRASETQVLVSVLGDDLSLAAELVNECWAFKLKAEYLLNKRVMKHIDRAKDSKIPWMVIVGERELNEGVVKLKDVVANKEEEVPRSKFVEELCKRLGSQSLLRNSFGTS